ncbi:hypothetical protein FQR65_LT03163 [Abscondita terminalis]|nr:hypothetical protein FQR65_LT03163 [Abscondita terminalis]
MYIWFLLITYAFLKCSSAFAQDVFVSNLNDNCLRCLCYAASNCDLRSGCNNGHCGPYQLGYSYWKDAGTPTIAGSRPNSMRAFQTCALTLPCAQSTVKQYIARYGKDCNNDGVTDCDDFAMINYNGAFNCEDTLFSSFSGRVFWNRYVNCMRPF